jgi:hypothetical protein
VTIAIQRSQLACFLQKMNGLSSSTMERRDSWCQGFWHPWLSRHTSASQGRPPLSRNAPSCPSISRPSLLLCAGQIAFHRFSKAPGTGFARPRKLFLSASQALIRSITHDSSWQEAAGPGDTRHHSFPPSLSGNGYLPCHPHKPPSAADPWPDRLQGFSA